MGKTNFQVRKFECWLLSTGLLIVVDGSVDSCRLIRLRYLKGKACLSYLEVLLPLSVEFSKIKTKVLVNGRFSVLSSGNKTVKNN